LVISSDKDSLVEALRKLISDPILYAKFKNGCREAAAQLSWVRLTEQMEGYYMETLAHTNGRH